MEHPLIGKTYRRTLSFALALSMLFSIFPVQMFAAEQMESASEAVSDSETASTEERETEFLSAEPMETSSEIPAEKGDENPDNERLNATEQTSDGVTNALEQDAEAEQSGGALPAESSLMGTAEKSQDEVSSEDDTDAPEIIASGECGENGDNLTWTLDADGLLTIRGEGEMSGWNGGSTPWKKSQIKNIVIEPGATSIGAYAFSSSSQLKSVAMSDSITNVGVCAFQYCSQLTSVTLSNSLAVISKSAFNRTGLTSVLFPESLTSIGERAFEESNLSSVAIPSAVDIGQSAFCGCKKLKSASMENGVASFGEYAFRECVSLTDIVIPDGVTSLSNYMFLDCASLTNVTIPDSVTIIGEGAFKGCSNLVSIEIPGSVTTFREYVFQNCVKLKNVSLSDGLTTMHSYAFAGCAAMESIIIPDSVTGVGPYAFSDCSSLKYVTLPQNLAGIAIYSFRGCKSLTSIEIPSAATVIREGAFSRSGLTTLIVPNSVVTIGSGAFESCSNLTNIQLSNAVTEISDRTFSGCVHLTDLVIPDSVKTIGATAFYNCRALMSITIPSGVTSVGSQAFRDCASLTSVTIPDSVKTIGGEAFYSCGNLTSVVIPNGVTSIAKNTFCNCASLTSVTIPNSVKTIGISAFYGCASLISVAIPDGVTSIGQSAFSSCVSLTSVIISDSVKSIGQTAFYGCKSLTSVVIGSGLTSMETHIFQSCTSLANVTLADGITSIGRGMFSGCSLTSVTIPNSVTSISDYAFEGCAFTSVTIPNSVTSIGSFAFRNCKNLTSVIIPDSVTSMGSGTFWGCSSLINIAVPNGVTSISESMFNGCASLTSVSIPNSVTSIGGYAFKECASLTNLVIPDSVTSIRGNAFYACTGLTSVTIPGSVTSLGGGYPNNSVFAKCANLKSVIISDGVMSIGDSAFEECVSLTSVTIPDSVTSIGNSAFRSCASLKNIAIPDSVTSIKGDTFRFCRNLTSITISDSVISIGLSAFDGCVALKEVYYIGAEEQWNAVKIDDGNSALANAEIHFALEEVSEEGNPIALVVKIPDGAPLDDGYSVLWYESGGIVPIAVGNALNGANPDSVYEYEVILDSELLAQYRQPGRVAVEDASVEEQICVLSPIPSVTVHGRVTDSAGSPLSNASVAILRTADNHFASIKTDADGDFSLTIQESGSVATVSKSGYFSVTKSLSFDGNASVNLGDIALTPLPEQKITLTLTRKEAAPEGTQPAVTALDSLSGLRFTLRDQTTNRQIHFAAQYPELLFDDGEVHGGEVIAIDAVDETGVMRAETAVVTLDEYGVGEASIPFVSNGSVQASLNGNDANIIMMLFSTEGNLTESTVSSGNTIVSQPLPDGNYTAVLMEKSSLLPVIPTLEVLAGYRLQEGADYAQLTANVTNGAVTDLGTVSVPMLDESKLSYMIAENTGISASAQSVTVGRYVSIRIQYELDSRYGTSGETLFLDFPESFKPLENSVTLDGEIFPHTSGATRLAVIAGKRSGTLRLYGMVTEPGDLTLTASLRFVSKGETLLQPIGTSVVEVSAASLELPERTGRKQIVVSGKAMVGSAVKIADNGTVMAETTVNKAGAWMASVPLLHPANNSRHTITAEITTGKGVVYHAGPSDLTYHEGYCEVERVTMINTAHGDGSLSLLDFVTTFEFIKPDTSKHAYNYWPLYPDFTFIVEMTGEAETVKVVTTSQNGDKTSVDCVWDEASGKWIGTHRYTSYSTVPVGVSVSFTQKSQSGVTQKSGVSFPGVSGADERFLLPMREVPSVPSAVSTFAVSGVSPDRGGNGPVTLCVRGRLLEPNAVVSLVGGNGTIGAKSLYWRNHETLYATFDLSDAEEGAYSLRIACGDHSVTRENCFTVDPDLAYGELSYNIHISETAGTGNALTGYVTATNIGYTDVNAPTLALTGENLLLGNDGGSADAEVLSVFLQNGDGLSGTLAHGETAGCNFAYAPQKDGSYALRLADYATLNGAISAPEGSDAVTERLLTRMGGTYPAFAANAARMANALDASLDAVSLETILSAYLQNMAGIGGNAMEPAATDLVSMNLSVSRSYFAPVFADDSADSNNTGLFGAGWISLYDITAASAIDSDTGVITVTDADSVSLYVRNDSGQYVNILSEQDTASVDGQGRITVTRRSGEELVFNADGKLVSDTDLNGNRITLSYGGGKLSSVTSSDGDSIAFAYENGVLSSATSGKTGDTVSYQYDGGRLTAVTTKYGATRYGYCADSFLARIEYPDRTFVNYTRDSYGRVTKVGDGDLTVSVSYGLYETTTRDSMGHVSRTHYDSAGNAAWSIDEENRVSYAFYDDNLRLVRLSQGLLHAVSYGYDESGLPARVTLPDGSVTAYSYDALGNITGVTDPKGQTTVYERDGVGNTIALRYPDNSAETFAYDAQGRVSAATNRSGVTRSYSYDNAGNVTKIEWSTGETIQYSYDKFGNVTAITENGETIALEYNGNGDLTKVTYPDGKSVSYAYDSLGRRISVTDADGYVTGYAYNAQGLLDSVTDGATELIHYDWNSDGTLNRQRNANGTATQYAYGGGNLTAIEHLDANGAVFSAFYYGYDTLGNLTTVTDNSGTWRYKYDGQGQLTRAESPSGDVTEYAYDAVGNRTAVTVNGKTTAYAANVLNQCTRYGDVSREYDADGNLIRETGPDGAASYEWDYQGRLVKYTDSSGAVYEYGYDAFGLRNRVKADGKETAYLNDPTGYGYALASYGGDTETHYALAGGIAAARIGETTYFYNANHLGSVTELTGDGGAVVNRYAYNQEGDVTTRVESVENPYTYVGVYGIVNDGNGLIYDRARYVSTATNSFISPDPTGQENDLNIYRYSGNNVLSNVDLNGHGYLDQSYFWAPLLTAFGMGGGLLAISTLIIAGLTGVATVAIASLAAGIVMAIAWGIRDIFYEKAYHNKTLFDSGNYIFNPPWSGYERSNRLNSNNNSIRIAWDGDRTYRFPDNSVTDIPLPGIDDSEQYGLNTIITTIKDMIAKADPSGYVYGGAASNRIEGVTATIYYQGYPLDDFGEPDTEAGIQIMEWTDAADYGEVNPQTTNAFGQYGWDVIPGQWQVRFSKDGYQPLETDWMEVPPEYFDVNMNLQTTTPPEVKSAEAYPDSVRVEFTQYMRMDSVTNGAISVKADGVPVSGTVSASNAEYDYERLNQYASVFLFTSDETMSGEVSVAVQNAVNYAGIAMRDAYQVGASVTPKPETLSVEEIAAINHHGETTLTVKILPAEAGANRTVRVRTSSSLIASPESDTLTTDASGQATLKVTGSLPGSARLTFTLDGTDLTAETQIAVASLLSGVCADVTASVTPGTVAKGTSVILACATEGATIYYTLDGTSAANAENPARQVYASPIVLEENTRIRACAEKADCTASEETSFSYRMEAAPATEYASGDVDGDGNVGMKDLSLLRRYLNGWSVEVVPEAMDTDGDSNVTMKDFSVLRRYLNGWPVTLGGNAAA